MKPLPLSEEMKAIAKRVVWFEEPEQSLRDPVRFLSYAMTYALHEDMSFIRRFVSDDELREVIANAPPGIIDPRSWAYWHLKLDRYPAPDLPTRKL
jgi:hypothetical protein